LKGLKGGGSCRHVAVVCKVPAEECAHLSLLGAAAAAAAAAGQDVGNDHHTISADSDTATAAAATATAHFLFFSVTHIQIWHHSLSPFSTPPTHRHIHTHCCCSSHLKFYLTPLTILPTNRPAMGITKVSPLQQHKQLAAQYDALKAATLHAHH
jgi:hypothetical protein